MTTVLHSSSERQRLLTRLEYLLRQYHNLNAVSHLLSETADSQSPVQLEATDLYTQLEEQRDLLESNELDQARRSIGLIGGTLYEMQELLQAFDSQISVYQIRTRFQQSETCREEIAMLLQFMLSRMVFTEDDFEKIDYLTTRFYALSIRAGGGFAFENKVRQEYQDMLDYAGITGRESADLVGMENLDFIREELASATSFQQLAANQTLERFRAFKAGLERRRLHPDVMVALARVNLLAGERFELISQRASERIGSLATRLISAGISEVEELKDAETTLIEEVLKSSLRDTSLLNEDYRSNRERIERLAQANDALARAHERLGLADTSENEFSYVVVPQPSAEMAAELADCLPVPERFSQDLAAQVARINSHLSADPVTQSDLNATIEIACDKSTVVLHGWEKAAFQDNYPRLRVDETSLGSLFRVSVALMAELLEKQDPICQAMRFPGLRNNHINGVRHLMTFSRQMLHELEECSSFNNAVLSAEIRQQIQQTQHKLAATCTQFSAKLQEALT